MPRLVLSASPPYQSQTAQIVRSTFAHFLQCSKSDEGMQKLAMTGNAPSSEGNFVPEVIPRWVPFLDQVDFPASTPFFQRLLTGNRRCRVVMRLVVNQVTNKIALGEAFDQRFPMLINSTRQITSDTNVEDAVRLTRHNVDEKSLA